MRLKPILFIAFVIFTFASQAQVLRPAKWSTSTAPATVSVGQEIDVVFKVAIDKDWYLYSTDFSADCGPTVTTFKFKPSDGYALVGGIVAIKPKAKHDKVFDCDVKIFIEHAEFRQKIKVLKSDFKIEGSYDYQVCTDISGRCIPFEDDFTVGIKGTTGAVTPDKKKTDVTLAESSLAPLSPDTVKQTQTSLAAVSKTETTCTGPVLDKSILDGESPIEQKSLVGYLIFAFLIGFTSLLTPCVFPMIPMTVTFFLKDNQTRRAGVKKALIFGVSIIVIYTAAGTLFAVLLGTDGLNALATHWAPNLFVSAIFIVFALSFFGLFEINAPYQLVNKVDSKAEKGGLAGIFFMAATLVLVSFSCTVPIVGSVLFLAANGEIIKPILSMFFYSLAFAIPFTVFAIFPELLKSLPKSGGWLNAVKVTFGFIELAFCLKFFSIADQAYHWGILNREVNISIWMIIFTLLGIYLLGKIKLPNDSPVDKVTVPRLVLAIASFSFVLYLAPGLIGAPLKTLAGYLPPKHTLEFDVAEIASSKNEQGCEEPKYAETLFLPHGLQGYFDYCQALKCARMQHKPLFIDFTGHGCTNCREMEATVWADPQVLKRLQNDFVVVALYVDDKTELPESEWITSKADGKVKKTIGKKNADIQISNLENNAQPYYILLGEDEKVLAWPHPYDKDVTSFVKFLETGKAKFKQLYQH